MPWLACCSACGSVASPLSVCPTFDPVTVHRWRGDSPSPVNLCSGMVNRQSEGTATDVAIQLQQMSICTKSHNRRDSRWGRSASHLPSRAPWTGQGHISRAGDHAYTSQNLTIVPRPTSDAPISSIHHRRTLPSSERSIPGHGTRVTGHSSMRSVSTRRGSTRNIGREMVGREKSGGLLTDLSHV